MNKSVVFVLLLLATGLLHAEIYKWTDDNGIVHFSDTPHPGAEKITLAGMQTYTPPPPPATPTPTGKDSSPHEAADEIRDYKITIVQPHNQATICNNQGNVAVTIEITPELKPGALVQLLYDGEVLGKPQNNLTFALNDINRGAHIIVVQVVDDQGRVLSSSEAVTFFMQRPRVGMVSATQPQN